MILGVANAAAGQSVGRGSTCVPPSAVAFRSVGQAEVDALIKDAAATNPEAVKRFGEDPELRRGQLNSLRDLLALASQAAKDGLAAEQANCDELGYIREESIAVRYDRHVNKGKPAKPAFGHITPARISAFWNADVRGEREKSFQHFLTTKKTLLIDRDPTMKNRTVSDEEMSQARDLFAKIEIYAAEYRKRSATIPKSLRDSAAMQVKLQQAQFLARLYFESIAAKTKATEQEIKEYVALRPELNGEAKRTEAEKILARAKSGEDFATLANEFSQDPGNKTANGVQHGGIYRDVKKGSFVKPFEDAVIAIEAGQIYPSLVESDFGYHIIKLERKGDLSAADGTYDARHILISTMVANPSDPSGRELPLKSYAASEIEAQKQRKLIAQLVAANNISVPEDFAIPAATEKVPAKANVARPAKRPARKRR